MTRRPFGRWSPQDELAALVLFLAGPDNGFFVGQVVPYSSGWAN